MKYFVLDNQSGQAATENGWMMISDAELLCH